MNNNQKKLNKKTIVLISIVTVLAVSLIIGAIVLEVNKINYGKQIKSINVCTHPKTQYFVGELADFSDLSVEVLLNNGKTYYVGVNDCEITGFSTASVTEKMRVSIEYQGHFCYFNAYVKEVPKPLPYVIKISLEVLPKTTYVLGEPLDTSGGVIKLEYNDSPDHVERVDLLNGHVSGFSSAKAGIYELTVKYEKNGVLYQTTYNVTVIESNNG